MSNTLQSATTRALAAGLLLTLAACSHSLSLQRPRGIDQYIAGQMALQQGNRGQGQRDLQAAIQDNPNLIMARAVLGDIYQTQGQWDKAADQYRALCKLDPYTASHFYDLGLCDQYINQLQEAADAYQTALELEPDDVKTLTNLGAVDLALNQIDQATEDLKKATELDDHSAYSWANLGVALDAKGDLSGAEKAYRKALVLDPNQATVAYNLGSNLISQSRPTEAIDVLQQVLKSGDSPQIHKCLGDALVLAKRDQDAQREYRAAIHADDQYYQAMNALGTLLITQYRQGAELDDPQRQEAIKMWRQSLAVAPNQPQVQALLTQWSAQ